MATKEVRRTKKVAKSSNSNNRRKLSKKSMKSRPKNKIRSTISKYRNSGVPKISKKEIITRWLMTRN